MANSGYDTEYGGGAAINRPVPTLARIGIKLEGYKTMREWSSLPRKHVIDKF